MSDGLMIDNFRLGNCIATGSTSQIYEVFDQDTNERFAMKLLLDEAFKDATHRATLKREFKVASALEHPNIIPVYAHHQSRKNAYFLMEFFGGPNLKQIIRGDITVVQARFRKMFECVLLGLGFIHENGWLHRDIKPDNIMMTKGTDVRIIDFSLSSKAPSAVAKLFASKKAPIQGTRTYIAPELVRRKLPSKQSDMYSLGVTAFECLTGRPPFMGSSPNDLLIKHIQEPPPPASSLNPNLTTDIDKLLNRLLAKKPENRPADAAEILSEFRSVKIFREDPEEFSRRKKAEAAEAEDVSVESQLDSRADAERQAQRRARGEDPTASKPKPVEVAKPEASRPAAAPAKKQQSAARPAPPRQPQAPQQQPPQRHPQQPPPGYQMPPGYPQQPGQPNPYAPQGYPQQPHPGQGAPAPRQPQGRPPQPAPPRKPAPPPQKPSSPPDDDIPFADELPDIS